MELIFLLSGENLDLAREEILALTYAKKYKQFKNILVLNTNFKDFNRLAFTHKVYRYLFECKLEDLKSNIEKVKWNNYYKKSFCVRTKHMPIKEKGLASLIWHRLKKPRVDLENPGTQIEFIFNGKVFCGILLKEIGKDYVKRTPGLKPGFHPTSMDPKLAKALVNLTCIKKNETFLDPFMGVGGILIEAGLLGCKLIGNDLYRGMIWKAKLNLKHYNLKAKLFNQDALTLNVRADAIATDLPYGKCSFTSEKNIEKLYKGFLIKAYDLLKPGKRLIVVLPKSFKIKSKFKKLKEIKHYMNKSLTRRILVFQK